MKKSILLTGISGFIGSNIAKKLLECDIHVIGTIRQTTNLWRLKDILASQNLTLINTDRESDDMEKFHADILIHTAWSGVSAVEREDWGIQTLNINYTIEILLIAKKLGIKKIIALGSQSEYGYFSDRIDENSVCSPNSVYGATKLATLNMLKYFAEQNNLDWYWLRLFSVFGEKEGTNWFIPFLIEKLSKNEELNLTNCEQKYDYIYIEDLANAILSVVNYTENNSGIYNLSSNKSVVLKEIVHKISTLIGSNSKINLGALPYRVNQVMHMEGNSNKFVSTFKLNYTNFEVALNKTIQYFLVTRFK